MTIQQRGRNRYDLDRIAAAQDELEFALCSLDDLESEDQQGNIGPQQFERLHAEYVVRAAEAARRYRHETSLRPRFIPQRARTRAAIAVVLLVATGGTVAALMDGSHDRAAGQTITGDTATATTATRVAQMRQSAEAAPTSGDLTTALKDYLAVLDLDAHDVESLTYAGWISYLGGAADQALALLNAAVKADPGYPDAHAFRGIVLYKARHDAAAAAAELRTYLRLVPSGAMSQQVQAVLTQVQRR